MLSQYIHNFTDRVIAALNFGSMELINRDQDIGSGFFSLAIKSLNRKLRREPYLYEILNSQQYFILNNRVSAVVSPNQLKFLQINPDKIIFRLWTFPVLKSTM